MKCIRLSSVVRPIVACWLSLLVTLPPSASAFEEGLLGFWPFDEGAGTEAANLSGEHPVVFVEEEASLPEWVEGKVGSALHFDEMSYAKIENFYGVAGNTPRTISMWLKTDWQVPGGATALVGWGVNEAGRRWHFKFEHTTQSIRTENQGGQNYGSDIVVTDGEWHHVVSVLPEGGTTIGDTQLYVDGVLLDVNGNGGQTVDTATDPDEGAVEVTIGMGFLGETKRFSLVTLDELAIWERGLSQEEIQLLAEGARPISEGDPNLVAPTRASLGQVTAVPPTHEGSFTIRNLGEANPLNISAIEVEGANADRFTVTGFPETLAPGASADVTYVFDSQGESGGFFADLVIRSDEEAEPEFRVNVSASVINRNGPVAHYRLDESAGAEQVNDASGWGRHGNLGAEGVVTFGEPALADGSAAQISGGGRIEVPGSSFEAFDAFTIASWVRPDSVAGTQTLAAFGPQTPDWAVLSADGAIAWFVTGELKSVTDPVLVAGESVHVAVVYSPESLVVYANGEEVLNEADPDPIDFVLEDTLFSLGSVGGALPFAGVMDDVQLYGRVLAAEDVQFLFNHPGKPIGGPIDSDGDGLSDEEEVVLGTDPLLVDSDFDGLEDGDEVNIHNTNPASADSDGDGWLDGVELTLNLDPNDAASVGILPELPPTAPVAFNEIAALPTFDGNGDTEDVTFTVWIDFDPKPEGTREVIFETGGGTVGLSLVYEANSLLVLRASGSGGLVLATASYPLSQAQLDAGELPVAFTYDVEDPDGFSTISLFVGDVLGGRVSAELGGDWTGSDGASFGAASGSMAGTGMNTTISGDAFASGTLNLEKGLGFFSGRLYNLLGDEDGDGLDDEWELSFFPGDLTQLGADADLDEDGLLDLDEFVNTTDPTEPDTDGDGLSDGEEVNTHQTSPLVADTDGDKRSDGEEINGNVTSDPLVEDTDDDGFRDGFEVAQGSDPNNANDFPDDIGEPDYEWTEIAALPTFDGFEGGLDQQDVTFRVCIDFDPAEVTEEEREMIWESGGGTVGFALVYETGNNLVLRAAGNGGNTVTEVTHTLTADQIAAGELSVIWSFDVDNGDPATGQTIALYIDEVLVGEASGDMDRDWTGANDASFGEASPSFAAGGGNTALSNGVAFQSGSINLDKGLQMFAEFLFDPNASPEPPVDPGVLEMISLSFNEGGGVDLAWRGTEGTSYDVEHSADLQSWIKVNDAPVSGVADGVTRFEDTDAGRVGAVSGYYRAVQAP